MTYGDLRPEPIKLPSSSETVILSFFGEASMEDVLSRIVAGGLGFEARLEPSDVGEASSTVNRESKGVGSLCSRRVNVSVHELCLFVGAAENTSLQARPECIM